MIQTVLALTFCLTLLAPTAGAGSPAAKVDALTPSPLTLHFCIQRTTCDDGVPVTLHRPELKCTICGQPLEPEPQLSAAKAKRQLCEALQLMPLVPLPATCRREPDQQATKHTP